MTLKNRSTLLIFLFILMPILFLLYVFYGFTNHETTEILKSTSFEEYKKDIKKKQYTNIEDLALPSTINDYEIWYKTINSTANEKLLFN